MIIGMISITILVLALGFVIGMMVGSNLFKSDTDKAFKAYGKEHPDSMFAMSDEQLVNAYCKAVDMAINDFILCPYCDSEIELPNTTCPHCHNNIEDYLKG